MKIDLHPRDVIALEQQDELIRRMLAAEKQTLEAERREGMWRSEAARYRREWQDAEHRVKTARDQNGWWLVISLALAGLNVFQFVAAKVAQ